MLTDLRIDVKQVGRELSVRYVLEGSVRKAAGRVRITAQLIDATTGAHLWADRFDGSLEEVFELQDKVAISVAGAIEPALQDAEIARSAGRPTTDLSAYDLYLRAGEMMRSASRQVPKALDFLEQAIARDPGYGPALARAGVCCLRLLAEDRSKEPVADRRKSADFARRALEVAGDDPVVLSSVAMTLATLGEDIGAMIMLTDRALALNPNYAHGWCQRRREIESAAGVRIHHRLGGPVQRSDVQTQLSSSINEPAFPSRPASPEPRRAA